MEFVMKVKYGDTLRRFNVLTNGDDLDLNMDRLRSKIIGLFKLQPDSDLILTYIDEDNDAVTLVDDDDLRDAVVTQRLNPLRINVLLKTSRATTSEGGSQSGASVTQRLNPLRINLLLKTSRATTSERGSQSGASTPIRSPRVPSHPPPGVSAGIEEAMKSAPEPFQDVVLKFSNDFMSKAATSAPVENLSKLGQSHLGPLSQGQGSALQSNPTGDQCPNLNIPVVSISIQTVLPNVSSVDQIPKDVPKNNDGGNMMGCVGTSSPSKGYSVNGNLELPKDSLVSPVEGPLALLGTSAESDSETQKEIKSHQSGKSQPDIAHSDPFKDLNPHASESSEPTYGEHDGFPRSFHQGVSCDGCGMHPITGPRFKSKVKENFDLCNFCFSQMGNDADYIRIDRAGYTTTMNTHREHDGFPRPFHRGVSCDGCGMQPIMGPRFKSKVKGNFDLCNVCFSRMGSDADYIRID